MLGVDTRKLINKYTRLFYRECADSFSQTREEPWEGWDKVLEHTPFEPFVVLDLGCGNMRFERYLQDRLRVMHVFALDNCPELVPAGGMHSVKFIKCDLTRKLPEYKQHFDLSVCFGLMHHIPYADARRKIFSYMITQTKKGCTIAISFWQFEKDEKLLAKAKADTARFLKLHPELESDFEEGDYMLGWQDRDDVFRFCHSFSDEEIDALYALFDGRVEKVDDYTADRCNRYLVMQKYKEFWEKYE